MTIRPTGIFGGYAKSVSQPSSATARIEKLTAEKKQLEQDAERLGLVNGDPNNPLVASHNRVVAKIDAELALLQKREGIGPEKAVEAAAEPEQAAPKQVIQRMPDRQGVYPPGTFLDIYA